MHFMFIFLEENFSSLFLKIYDIETFHPVLLNFTEYFSRFMYL